MSGRHLPAFGISAIAHAAVFLILTLTLYQTSESQFIPAQSDENIPPQAHLVWLAVPGDGGGGATSVPPFLPLPPSALCPLPSALCPLPYAFSIEIV
jgi:hypothetical protein